MGGGEQMITRRHGIWAYFILFSMTFAIGNSTQADVSALTPELAELLSHNVNRSVIVLLKNRVTDDEATSDQEPLIDELRQVGGIRVKRFRMINAIAATVSEGELARLKAHPMVAQVIPDRVIRRAPSQSVGAIPSRASGAGVSALIPNVIPGACGDNGKVQLEPEALETTHTNSDTSSTPTARSLGLTGAGVKVAYMAEGIDTQNVNFLRADGTSAFADYQDFSGDGPGGVTDGDEAFLDANAIAGQGLHVYDVSNFSAQSAPAACNVRIEGVAPGVDLVGLKVFSQTNDSTQSGFLQAIEYAVSIAHVNVLNESFGSNLFPDVTSADILKQFNDAAVQAGVTVTVSSGDAGSTNTIGTPATDPLVISVGASTTYRFYAQTNYAAARYFATTGWLNDNISPLSSGGFTQTGATLDLVAPGDLAFASCDASSNYQGCLDLDNRPSNVEKSGGTSMAGPLTAGAAALVIQAYRQSHANVSPTPAMVKQILLSAATDLGLPSIEQGAGILNSYKAVVLAEMVDNGTVPASQPATSANEQPLLFSVNQLNGVGVAASKQRWPVTVTNTTQVGQQVTVTGRTFGPIANVQTGVATLMDSSSPQFVDFAGVQSNYQTFTFTVPASGADKLNASLAYPGNAANGDNARIRLILIDPKGRFAAHSVPQGVGNFGSVDVRTPLPGTWTGVIFGEVASAKGTNGKIPWQISTQSFVPFGRVSRPSFFLAPGESQTFRVAATVPTTPGDSSGAIVITSSVGGTDTYVGTESGTIPVTLRSLVNLASGGGFGGIVTGGNGRPDGGGQTQYYEFDVDAGHSSLVANLSLTNDGSDTVGLYLVNPDGVAVGFGQNSIGGSNSLSVTASTLNPPAGRWTLIASFSNVVGNEIAQAYTGSLQLDPVVATASELPNSMFTQLPAGVPVTIPVTVTNSGAGPVSLFIDARLDSVVNIPLAAMGLPTGFKGFQVPLPLTAQPPQWLVPTQTLGLLAVATANVPIEFDYSPSSDPDLYGTPTDNGAGPTYTAQSSYTPTGGVVSPGIWTATPSEIGPYPASGAPEGLVNFQFTATTKAFDMTITAPTGDLWLSSTNASYSGLTPVIVNPGESTVINVTLTPSGASGAQMSGTLYVDASVPSVPPFGQTTGSEYAAIPYVYTVK